MDRDRGTCEQTLTPESTTHTHTHTLSLSLSHTHIGVDSGAGLRGLESLECHDQQMGDPDALLGRGRRASDHLSRA